MPTGKNRNSIAAGKHNRIHGTLCMARGAALLALRAPSLTPEAEAHIAAALTALDAACDETYRRRVNPDGTIWERDGCK